MSDWIEIRYNNDKSTKNSLLKFGKPAVDLGGLMNANLREVKNYNEESEVDKSIDLDVAQPWQVRSHRRQEKAEKYLASTKSTVLSVGLNGAKKDYYCRSEEGVFENSSFFVMRNDRGRITMSPVTSWYYLTPTVNFRNLDWVQPEIDLTEKLPNNSIPDKMKKFETLLDVEEETKNKKDEKFDEDDQNEAKKIKTAENDGYGLDLNTFETLSSNESVEELNEQGKELNRILKRTNNPNDDSDISIEEESEGDSDIDALEKKYSDSSIFKTGKHFESNKTEEKQKSEKPNQASTKNDLSQQITSQSKKNISSKESAKLSQIETYIEEKIRKYLSRHSMNTILLLKKLLTHAPPDYRREEIVITMAKILKRMGVQKKAISGQTFLDLSKK